ncbi:MAG: hypothetical protein AAF266_03220 [Planctomycetota bacterium]
MRFAPITLTLLLATFLFVANPSHAVTIGQLDDFQSLTTEGWIVGIGDENPVNVDTGGPAGGGDAYLRYDAVGGGGPFSKMIYYNTSQWTGDYVTEGITGLTADVINEGATPLELRLAFGDGRSARNGNWFASTESITLAPGSGWQSVFLPIDEGSLTSVLGTDSYADLMSNVGAVRILSSTSPSNIGDTLVGSLGVDNLQAIPEPTALALLVPAVFAAMRRRG